jgi:hypothetical protein
MLRLPQHRPLPVEAKPRQVTQDRGLELGSAAGEIDVLEAQDEPAARGPRRLERDQRRGRVALVQQAGGRWREAGGVGQCLKPPTVKVP